mgnify:CR=1 FL=1
MDHCFPPVVSPATRLLLLGSLPGAEEHDAPPAGFREGGHHDSLIIDFEIDDDPDAPTQKAPVAPSGPAIAARNPGEVFRHFLACALRKLEGMGHNLPRALWPRIMDEIDATVERTHDADPTRHTD